MSFHCSLLICIISVEKSAKAFKTESGAGGGRLLVWLMYVRLKRWSFVNSEIFFITLFIPFISDVSQKEDDRRRKTFCWLYVFRTVRFHSNDPSVVVIPIIFNFSFGYVSLVIIEQLFASHVQWTLTGNIPYFLQDEFWCSLCARKGIRIGIWFQVHFILKENKGKSLRNQT